MSFMEAIWKSMLMKGANDFVVEITAKYLLFSQTTCSSLKTMILLSHFSVIKWLRNWLFNHTKEKKELVHI